MGYEWDVPSDHPRLENPPKMEVSSWEIPLEIVYQ